MTKIGGPVLGKYSGSGQDPHERALKSVKHKKGSFEKMNAERKRQGYKPIRDRASKGLYEFLDK